MAISHTSGSANPEGPIVVQFDASVRTTPHYPTPSAAIGYVISSAKNTQRLETTSHSLGEGWVGESKHAEFEALLAAVDAVLDTGYRGHVILHTDSAEVARAVSKGDATPTCEAGDKYLSIARQKLNHFESFSINNRPRDTNGDAHSEARRGHNASVHSPYVHPQ